MNLGFSDIEYLQYSISLESLELNRLICIKPRISRQTVLGFNLLKVVAVESIQKRS